jgi:hypothetical protein
MPKKQLSSKPFDTTFKHLIELRPRDIVAFLGVPDVRSVELVDAELSTIVAAADRFCASARAPGAPGVSNRRGCRSRRPPFRVQCDVVPAARAAGVDGVVRADAESGQQTPAERDSLWAAMCRCRR